jgi:hypothetical protein
LKYEKNEYVEGLSICGLIIAGIFLYMGITGIYKWNPGNWTWFFNWVWLLIGLACLGGQINKLRNRSKLRNVVLHEFEVNPNATVEEISRNTGISQKDVRAIILDLKADGQLRGKFSTSTGQMKYTEIKQKSPAQKTEPSKTIPSEAETKSKYCPNCGTPISKESAKFCAYCGGKLR